MSSTTPTDGATSGAHGTTSGAHGSTTTMDSSQQRTSSTSPSVVAPSHQVSSTVQTGSACGSGGGGGGRAADGRGHSGSGGGGGGWHTALRDYVTHPERHKDVIVHHDSQCTVVKDKFPKARKHFLVMPNHYIPDLRHLTADDIPLVR